MKSAEIIKDLIISILVVTCIILVLCAIFYNDISFTKVIPESEEYFLTEEMQQEIEDSNLESMQEVVVNYYIDATDLKKYEKTNEYNKGKKNPFAVEESTITNDTTDIDNINSNESSNNDGNSENFYENDGTK